MNGSVLTPEKEKENYEEMADYYRENGDTAEAEYYTGLADSLSFFIEEKIGTDSGGTAALRRTTRASVSRRSYALP